MFFFVFQAEAVMHLRMPNENEQWRSEQFFYTRSVTEYNSFLLFSNILLSLLSFSLQLTIITYEYSI